MLDNLTYYFVLAFSILPKIIAWEVGRENGRADRNSSQHLQHQGCMHTDLQKTLLTPVKLTARCYLCSDFSLQVCPRDSCNTLSCAHCLKTLIPIFQLLSLWLKKNKNSASKLPQMLYCTLFQKEDETVMWNKRAEIRPTIGKAESKLCVCTLFP